MNSDAKNKIVEIVRKHGIEICRDIAQCSALIRENLASFTEEKELFLVSVRTGIPLKLLSANRETVQTLAAPRLAKQLESDAQTSEDKARWVVDAWIDALGLLPAAPVVEETPRVVEEVKEHKVIAPPEDKIIWQDSKPTVKDESTSQKPPLVEKKEEEELQQVEEYKTDRVEKEKPETERAVIEPVPLEKKKKDDENAWDCLTVGALFWLISAGITSILLIFVGWDGRLAWYSVVPLIFLAVATEFDSYAKMEQAPGCDTIVAMMLIWPIAFCYWINGAQVFHSVVFGWNMFSDKEIAIFGIRAFWDEKLSPGQLMTSIFDKYGFFAKVAVFIDVYVPILSFISIPASIKKSRKSYRNARGI